LRLPNKTKGLTDAPDSSSSKEMVRRKPEDSGVPPLNPS